MHLIAAAAAAVAVVVASNANFNRFHDVELVICDSTSYRKNLFSYLYVRLSYIKYIVTVSFRCHRYFIITHFRLHACETLTELLL